MNITIQDLADAGVHFGHQIRRWNPKSKPYVYDNRHGISVIDLEKTLSQLEQAYALIEDVVASGKDVLFVGTKRQASEILRESASSVNMPFCVNRWLGGTLTNGQTISTSIAKFKKFKKLEETGELAKMHKKEASVIRRNMGRMHRNFEGIQDMVKLPAVMFVVDTKVEAIAVAEAHKMGIKVVAIVDTNSDPTVCDLPIPGNDDAVKSIRVITNAIVEAIQNGLDKRQMEKVTPKAVKKDAAKDEQAIQVEQ